MAQENNALWTTGNGAFHPNFNSGPQTEEGPWMEIERNKKRNGGANSEKDKKKNKIALEGQNVDVMMEEENKRKEKDVIKETITDKTKKAGEKDINKGAANISMLRLEFNISKGITKFNARTKILGVVHH
eukprot:7711111-Ditylum_brightwellii.AAC.1